MAVFFALQLREHGRPIPKWRRHTISVVEGVLIVGEERDQRLQRTVRKARFLDPGNRRVDIFVPLVDAQLLHADENQLVLGGIQEDELAGVDFAQAWLLYFAARDGTG